MLCPVFIHPWKVAYQVHLNIDSCSSILINGDIDSVGNRLFFIALLVHQCAHKPVYHPDERDLWQLLAAIVFLLF